jgi:hypothetical protein
LKRRSLIAQDLSNSSGAVARLLSKVGQVLSQPHITGYQAIEVESIAERVELLFLAIQEAAGRKDYDLLLASVERLEMEIWAGEARLEAILKAG